MIYIDPPYNTGKDFVYKDNFKDNLKNYLEITGQIGEEGQRLSTNSETSGRYHSDWLNMMYPRLKLARNLLIDDGIIVINMDENEIINLQKLCDEIFGENNNLGTIIWDKRNPKGDSKGIAYQHEYILFYAKNREYFLSECPMLRPKKNAELILKKAKQIFMKINSTYNLEQANKEFSQWVNSQVNFSGGEKAYNKLDENGEVYRPVSMAWPNKSKAPDEYFIPLIHPITKKECPVPERGWRNPKITMENLLDKGLILFGKDETTQPTRKYLLRENMYENIPSLLYFGGSDTDLLKNLNIPFDTPKVVEICMEHILAFTNENSIILDFFSGSATTAHAVMQLNAEDGGDRKYIMVQLPEPCDEKSEAYKAGYRNICEIGKERIRRAGEKIKEEIEKENFQLKLGEEAKKVPDIGFKVFKLDSSNIKEWDPETDDIKQTLLDSVDNIKPDRTPLDVLYEIILKYGLELTVPIEEKEDFYSIGGGTLLINLDKKIDMEVIDSICKEYRNLLEIDEDFKTIVVLRDSAFKNDIDKTNAMKKLEQSGIKEVRSI